MSTRCTACSTCSATWQPPAPRRRGGQEHEGVVNRGPVRLRSVDMRRRRTFFGRPIGFHRRPPLPFLQVTWPDTGGYFHWEEQNGEEQAGEDHRESQPRLWLPPADHPVGIWTVEL
ncbi:DUF4262 domain-containing protein [Streptomyces sp. BF23-19]|uniref:DUF4262 domain-containing protein n=1 Tax=unclassified Streptomyces TaxID=2593676 RepID=UPI0034E5338F